MAKKSKKKPKKRKQPVAEEKPAEPAPAEPTPAEPEVEPAPAGREADAQAQGFRDSVARLRSRSDLTAKAIAGVGGAAIAAIGLAEYADVFPFDASWAWGLALLAGFVAMAVGVWLLARGFLRVQDPIVVRSDLRLIRDLDRAERQEVQAAFDDTAALNQVDSLLAYETRAARLRRIAERLPADRRGELLAEADAIEADVRAAHARAAHAAVRRRVASATRSRPAYLALVLITAGFALATVAADAIDAAREDPAEAVAEIPD